MSKCKAEAKPQRAKRLIHRPLLLPFIFFRPLDAVMVGWVGKTGDGKVWILELEQALRVRTGETGPDAI